MENDRVAEAKWFVMSDVVISTSDLIQDLKEKKVTRVMNLPVVISLT